MNLEWLNEVRKIDAAEAGYSAFRPPVHLGGPELLLGIPMVVRDDGGVPHLESDA